MEWDFRYLQGKYGDAGAREKFEEICHALLMKEYPGRPVHKIRAEGGDGGLDILIGDLYEPVHVFQCKFFLGKIEKSQKDQIRKSFQSARSNPCIHRGMREWTLMLPVNLSKEEREWWDTWKAGRKEELPDLSIDYLGEDDLLARLREHGLYELYFGDPAIQKLSEAVGEIGRNLSELGLQRLSNSGLRFITAETVSEEAGKCTQRDIRDYYRVNNGFTTMFRVIGAGWDVPHREAEEALSRLLEAPEPILIAGNGGWGKSSLMLRTAIQWARNGGMAVWLGLSASVVLNEAEAEALIRALLAKTPAGVPLLLCIDNPYEGRRSFQALQRAWPTEAPIRLLTAERSSRLSVLSDQAEDFMQGWFDGARVLELGGKAKSGEQFRELGYGWQAVAEAPERQRRILETALPAFLEPERLEEDTLAALVGGVLGRYGRGGVSLAELIYRGLFELMKSELVPEKKRVSIASYVVLDWEEWDRFLAGSLGTAVRDSYELIGAYMLFDTPLTLSLFCRVYPQIDRSALERALERRGMEEQTEPVAYDPQAGTLRPKHDVIAELYFLFHPKPSVNRLMERVLGLLNDEETDVLLDQIVDKREFLRGSAYAIGIDYRAYLEQIRRRAEAGEIALTLGGRANLCLGRLWLDRNAWKERTPTAGKLTELRLWLVEHAPAPMTGLTGRDLRTLTRLFVEWGIWERESGCFKAAEQRFREALELDPKDIPPRTELGRLLVQDRDRWEEAERVFREALELDPKNIPPRTELGRLLARDRDRWEEAERVFREALEIDPKNVPIRTELGRLLAQDRARLNDAERVFRDALEINPQNVPTITELGRLLTRDRSRWEEAERVFREALELDPKNIPPRTELGRLLAQNRDRWEEAERVLREAMEFDPENIPPRTELGRLLAQDRDRWEEAERVFREAMMIDPKNIPPRTELGRLLAQDRSRWEEAERVFRDALELDPQNAPIRTELGRLLARDRSRWEEAERVFREAMKLDPQDVHIRTELGRLLARDRDRREEAERIFREVLELDPKDVPTYTELGRLLAQNQNRWEEAEAVFRYALTLEPENVLLQSLLGRLLSKQPHRRKEAETLLKGIFAKHPKDIQARDILAKMYEKQKRYSEAYALYAEILRIKRRDGRAKEGLERLRAYAPAGGDG